MGFFSKLLGGEKATQQTAVDLTPPEFKGIRETVGDGLGDFLGDQPKFEGPFGATIDDTERGLTAQAVTQARTPSAGRTALVRTLNEGGATNPFLAASIEAAQRPIEEEFETDRETLRGAFARAGQRVGA